MRQVSGRRWLAMGFALALVLGQAVPAHAVCLCPDPATDSCCAPVEPARMDCCAPDGEAGPAVTTPTCDKAEVGSESLAPLAASGDPTPTPDVLSASTARGGDTSPAELQACPGNDRAPPGIRLDLYRLTCTYRL